MDLNPYEAPRTSQGTVTPALMFRYRLRTLLILLLLLPPLIAIYVAAFFAARDAARAVDQVRLERELLKAERISFANERAAQRASLQASPLLTGPGGNPNQGTTPNEPELSNM